MGNALELVRVTKEYGAGDAAVRAVDEVSFRLPKGAFWGIMGASGSGKSTLLNLIATIDRPTAGQIWINGQETGSMADTARFRRDHLGFIFQEYNLLDTLTLRENIALALTIQTRPEAAKTAAELGELLEIGHVLDKFPYQVSGGQRQRCACARALAARPDLILADEPTGALDSHAAKNMMDVLARLNRELGVTILMVTHDALSASCCENILLMRDGRIAGSLERGGLGRQAFFLRILDRMAELMGDQGYVS